MARDRPRRYPVGAEVSQEGVDFRVWAPEATKLTLVLESGERGDLEFEKERDGYFRLLTPRAAVGTKYRLALNGASARYPDPASRFQPEGPHGPSEVVDGQAYRWCDDAWSGVELHGQVLYELHIGTFTPEGTWKSAEAKLEHLAQLGITVVELMPLADFSGEFGWGYDGVNLFAPTRLYGTPDEFRQFVDRAHSLGIGVILDVVYNHFGPDGNYFHAFSRDYVTDHYRTDWGQAVNYDGNSNGPVRDFMSANAAYWIEEFHLDGLRFDATQNIYDSSDNHILAAMTLAAREAAGKRSIIITAENEEQKVRHVAPHDQTGFGMDALWNDDFHHAAKVALTRRSEAYYSDYSGSPQELISAIKWGFLYQGQLSTWQKRPRGTPSFRIEPERFVTYLDNHDQVANSPGSRRGRQMAGGARHRALTALWLLSPGTPMLFHGQEFGASTPFYYFADHHAELAALVDAGRKQFLSQFPSQSSPDFQSRIPDPRDRATFERSKLDWSECERNQEVLALHRDLLSLRREDIVLRKQTAEIDGAVLSADALVLRFFADETDDRLLVVNLGGDLHCRECSEPLLAPPWNCRWTLSWSSEDARYGGLGTPRFDESGPWFIPGQSAEFFVPTKGDRS